MGQVGDALLIERDHPVRLGPHHRLRGGIAAVADEIYAFQWPLFAVLAAQTFLSMRLVWSNTAFVDEATYIWAGRIELSHLINGTPLQPYPTYFSGAPTIYPLLAGLADIAGGLAAVRALSLAAMLGATCMLWGTTRDLFGRRAAVCATALFVAIGSTQFLGTLATYDATALFLMALAARLVVAARDADDSKALIIVIGAVAALTLANATKYASALFDPVVIGLAVLTSPRGLKAGLGRGGLIAVSTVGLVAVLLAIGGPWYVAGVEWTTLSRSAGEQPPALVLMDAVRWVGIVLALAVLALPVTWWRGRAWLPLVTWLALAGILAPANQARIHTTVSLSKHVDFGAWFACIAAGYAVAAITRIGRRRWVHAVMTLAAAVVIMVPAGALGRGQASDFTQSWPNATQITAELRVLSKAHPGTYLAEDYVVPGYYLQDQLSWQAWQSTWYFHYRAPGQDACIGGSAATAIGNSASAAQAAQAFTQAVAHQYFALIILNFTDTRQLDEEIAQAIKRDATYHVIASLPYQGSGIAGRYTVWAPVAVRKGVFHGASC